MTSYQTLRLETAGGLATLTLDRPDRMNGMTSLMVREAHDALATVAGDPSVSVLVLTGAGSSFCPGADLKAATSGENTGTADAHHFRVPVLLHEMPAITVAAINGACTGAGFGWAHYLAAEGGVTFGDYIDLETSDHLRIVRSADTAEAFRAFLEKRPAVFQGR